MNNTARLMLSRNIDSELNTIVQESIKEFVKSGEDVRMAFMPVSMDVFAWKEIAKKEYKKMQYSLGLSENEIDTIVEDSVSRILAKYFKI